MLGLQAMVSFGFTAAQADLARLAVASGESAGRGLREGGDAAMVLHAESEQPHRRISGNHRLSERPIEGRAPRLPQPPATGAFNRRARRRREA